MEYNLPKCWNHYVVHLKHYCMSTYSSKKFWMFTTGIYILKIGVDLRFLDGRSFFFSEVKVQFTFSSCETAFEASQMGKNIKTSLRGSLGFPVYSFLFHLAAVFYLSLIICQLPLPRWWLLSFLVSLGRRVSKCPGTCPADGAASPGGSMPPWGNRGW